MIAIIGGIAALVFAAAALAIVCRILWLLEHPASR